MTPDDEPTVLPPSFGEILRGTFDGIGDSLDAGPVEIGQRYPVTRTGDRQLLPRVLRWLIWHRDRGRCTFCGRGDLPLQLDHVVPWSAGGPDTSTNLRTLCESCNEFRSNFRTLEPIELLPVTAICDPCIDAHDDGGWPHGPNYAYCPPCNGQPFNRTTHPDAEQHVAFCGSCRRRSTVSDPARLL